MSAGEDDIGGLLEGGRIVRGQCALQVLGRVFEVAVEIVGGAGELGSFGDPLRWDGDGTGNAQHLILVVLPKIFLEIHKAFIAQRPAEADDGGFADSQLQSNLCGCHEAGVGEVVQDIFCDDLLSLCEWSLTDELP